MLGQTCTLLKPTKQKNVKIIVFYGLETLNIYVYKYVNIYVYNIHTHGHMHACAHAHTHTCIYQTTHTQTLYLIPFETEPLEHDMLQKIANHFY